MLLENIALTESFIDGQTTFRVGLDRYVITHQKTIIKKNGAISRGRYRVDSCSDTCWDADDPVKVMHEWVEGVGEAIAKDIRSHSLPTLSAAHFLIHVNGINMEWVGARSNRTSEYRKSAAQMFENISESIVRNGGFTGNKWVVESGPTFTSLTYLPKRSD